MKRIALLVLGTLAAVCMGSTHKAPPEFTHSSAADWINSQPLTLAGLKGKVVLVEFWAFECENCLNSAAWVHSIEQSKGPAGLVIVGVHTPELPQEQSPEHVRAAVERLGIHYPVMLDANYSYWNAMHNQYWPAFYLIGRDGLLYGSVTGELHVGDTRGKQVEQAIDLLLQAKAS